MEKEQKKVKVELKEDQQKTKPRPSVPCDDQNCEKVFVNNSKMRRHYKSVHERQTYPCDLCQFQAARSDQLKRHVRRVHERVKYPCDQCEFQAAWPHGLVQHKRNRHELGPRYPCSQCHYQTADQTNLRRHIEAKHNDVILTCPECQFQTKWRKYYLPHLKTHNI